MKMKSLCEATGLTDRAIRYYIAEALICPAYKENYLGRKTFDFCQEDIQQLNDIAVLRKFGFSIVEIREMIQNPDRIVPIVKELQGRKLTLIEEENKLMQALLRLDTNSTCTVAELAAFLSQPVDDTPLPSEDGNRNGLQFILSFLQHSLILLITWLPVAVTLCAILGYFLHYRYPVIHGSTFLILLLVPLPSILIFLSGKLKLNPRIKGIVKCILLFFCLLATPVSGFLAMNAFSISQTTNHHDYRRFDANSFVDRDPIFQDLFPAWPEYSNTKYYYCYSETVFGNTCDIYAQWSLDKEDFQTEIGRVTVWFDTNAATQDGLNALTVQQETYTCLVIYSGSPPFETATQDYTYYIFAYDEAALTVRYIYCSSDQNGADQPYYLSLEW